MNVSIYRTFFALACFLRFYHVRVNQVLEIAEGLKQFLEDVPASRGYRRVLASIVNVYLPQCLNFDQSPKMTNQPGPATDKPNLSGNPAVLSISTDIPMRVST